MRTSHVVLCRGRLGAHGRIPPSCGSNSELHNLQAEDPQTNTGIFQIQGTIFKGIYNLLFLAVLSYPVCSNTMVLH